MGEATYYILIFIFFFFSYLRGHKGRIKLFVCLLSTLIPIGSRISCCSSFLSVLVLTGKLLSFIRRCNCRSSIPYLFKLESETRYLIVLFSSRSLYRKRSPTACFLWKIRELIRGASGKLGRQQKGTLAAFEGFVWRVIPFCLHMPHFKSNVLSCRRNLIRFLSAALFICFSGLRFPPIHLSQKSKLSFRTLFDNLLTSLPDGIFNDITFKTRV